MSFQNMGYTLARNEIEESRLVVSSESKPFTTKVPSHVLEALDAVSDHFGLSRSSFVLELINSYLGSAFVDFYEGYTSVMGGGGDQVELVNDALYEFLKKSDLSEDAQKYFEYLVMKKLGLEAILEKQQWLN